MGERIAAGYDTQRPAMSANRECVENYQRVASIGQFRIGSRRERHVDLRLDKWQPVALSRAVHNLHRIVDV